MALRLVTFADGSLRWRLAGRRLERQAKSSGWFDAVHRWTAQELHQQIPQFKAENPRLDLSSTRGYGYWLWRPYILRAELTSLPPGDSLLFLDAGCQLNIVPESTRRLHEYIDLVNRDGSLIMQIPSTLDQWCKRDLLDHFVDEAKGHAVRLLEPGTMFLRNTESNDALIAEWIRWGQSDGYHYLDDSPSLRPNLPSFSEHRHDQAILTCLSTQHSLGALPQETYFPSGWRSEGARYPIWALRNSTPVVLEGNGLLSQAATRLRHRRHR